MKGSTMSLSRGLLISGMIYLGLIAGPIALAEAHEDCITKTYGGVDRAVGCIKNDPPCYGHCRLDGCDRYSDGLSTRPWYWIAQGNQYPGPWDPNGANSGCSHVYYTPNWFAYNICVESPVGCYGWTSM